MHGLRYIQRILIEPQYNVQGLRYIYAFCYDRNIPCTVCSIFIRILKRYPESVIIRYPESTPRRMRYFYQFSMHAETYAVAFERGTSSSSHARRDLHSICLAVSMHAETWCQQQRCKHAWSHSVAMLWRFYNSVSSHAENISTHRSRDAKFLMRSISGVICVFCLPFR